MDACGGARGGNCAGVVAVAAVSAAVTLATVRLYRSLELDFRNKILQIHQDTCVRAHGAAGRTATAAKKKKVRFADHVAEPSSNNEEYRRRRSRTAGGQT